MEKLDGNKTAMPYTVVLLRRKSSVITVMSNTA